MFSLLAAILGGFFFSLRVSSGSFPPPLSQEEEEAALRAVADGDESARNLLVEHNLRLVSHIIKKYYAQYDSVDDLISIGTLGLIKAVNTYRLDRATRFSTYAARCVENEIFMYFRSMRRHNTEISLDVPLDGDSDGGPDLSDTVGTDDGEMLERVDSEMESQRLRRLIAQKLEPRERRILTERYGLNGEEPRTQREIARRHGLSRSYVSRIEKKALEKLRKALLQ